MTLRRNAFLTILFGLMAAGSGHAEGLSPKDSRTSEMHWLGMNRIGTVTNAANFLKIWQLPETVKVQGRLLDEISLWLAAGNTNAFGCFRPLLDDVVANEAYAEWTSITNGATVRFALRLPSGRGHFWETNLTAGLERAAGGKPERAGNGQGWVWQHASPARRVEFRPAGDWTLLEIGNDSGGTLPDFAARVAQAAAGATNAGNSFWVQADLNLKDLLAAICPATKEQLSPAARISLTATGEEGEVRTRAEVDLGLASKMALSPWQIPTNLIHQPLISFTAMRGFGAWLAEVPAWQKLQVTPAPDQGCCWVQPDSPAQTYCAFPITNATDSVSQICRQLQAHANSWMATNGEGRFEWVTHPPGIAWHSAPLMTPFLKPELQGRQEFVFGGLVPVAATDTNPPPPATLRTVMETPNLVYYQSELTGPQIVNDLWNSQLFRMAFHRAQLPGSAPSILWIKAAEYQLGPSVTSVVQADSGRLVFTRKSTVGFTAIELHLLADWLESPQFPRGLHTFLAPPEN